MGSIHRRRAPLVLIPLVLALVATVLAGSGLPVAGQTAGPVATPVQPIVAGPSNGGVALGPSAPSAPTVTLASSTPAAVARAGGVAVATASPVSAPVGSTQPVARATAAPSLSGQGISPLARAFSPLNLTVQGGVNLIAGQSLVYVPPNASSCDATAQLSYTTDQAAFTAQCGDGAPIHLSQGLLCMQPSPEVLSAAKGNLANLSVTSGGPLASHPSPSGVLVCATVTEPATYTLSVTGQALAPPALHTLPPGIKVSLPAVGLGGLALALERP